MLTWHDQIVGQFPLIKQNKTKQSILFFILDFFVCRIIKWGGKNQLKNAAVTEKANMISFVVTG